MSDQHTDNIESNSDKGTILVVDDVKENLSLLDSFLTLNGYNVRPALNGELALNSIRSKMPDLVLLDIEMPVMNGYEVCRQLKADPKTSRIPIIFLSGIEGANKEQLQAEFGISDFIAKPIIIEEVLKCVEFYLNTFETN